jgi:hypothetical protein
MGMIRRLNEWWTICYKDGAIACDDRGQGHFYFSRREARMAMRGAVEEQGAVLHIEKVVAEFR